MPMTLRFGESGLLHQVQRLDTTQKHRRRGKSALTKSAQLQYPPVQAISRSSPEEDIPVEGAISDKQNLANHSIAGYAREISDVWLLSDHKQG